MDQTTQTTPPASTPNAGKGLGIAGLVLGILAAIISFIPCLGTFALIPGIIGIILSAISMVQANKAAASKGIAIAGLICSIVGCCLAGYQMYVIKTMSTKGMEEFNKMGGMDSLNKALEELRDLTDSTQNH
ncbi:MAG: hypothetical protein V4635_15715 [Bacteroidota bacterium]